MGGTIVLGASNNSNRYSYLAVERLKQYNHKVYPVGIKKGEAAGIKIINDNPDLIDIHTITIYLNSQRQKEYYDYILKLKPKRVIFNPGAENQELKQILKKNNIETVENCTLVMLSNNLF